METNGEWLTVNDAARLSGYHPESIRELIRKGKIKARKFSIVYQVDHKSLLAYMEKAHAMGEKRGRKSEK